MSRSAHQTQLETQQDPYCNKEFEEIDRLAMGEDVQQAQKLSVDAA